MKRRFALTTLLNAAGISIGFLTSMLLTPFMIHELGTESYGLWVLLTAFSVTSGYLSILDLGIQSALVKFVTEHHARDEQREVNEVVSASLYLFCVLGLLGFVALVVFSRYFLSSVFRIPDDLVPMMQMLLYLLAIRTLFEFPGLVLSAVVDGLQRYDIQRAVQIVYIVLYSLFVYLLLKAGYGLMAVSVTVLVLAVLRTGVLASVARRCMPGLRLTRHFDTALLVRLMRFSGEVFLIQLNAPVYLMMDKTIIAAMLSSTLLTQYDVASKLRNVALLSLSLITPQIVPIAARLNAGKDLGGLQRLFLRATKYQLALTLPSATAVYLLAGPFIELWIGPAYREAVGLVHLFVVYVVLDAVVAVGYNVMIGSGEVRPLFLVQILTTTGLNLAVSLVLTPRIGVAGVIWGTVIGTAASLVPYLRLYLRRLDLEWSRLWWEVVVPAISCTAVFAVVLVIMMKVVLPSTFGRMIGIGGVASVTFGLCFWAFGMTSDERWSARHLLVPRVVEVGTG